MRRFAKYLCFIPFVTAAQADPISLPERLIEKGAPGAGVAVYKDGQTHCEVKGLRAIGHDTPAQQDDLWHIGSLTKSMTATLVARLVEQGLISWETPVGDVLNIPDLPQAAQQITLTQLLSHRSGLPDNLGMSETLALAVEYGEDALQDQRQAYSKAVLVVPLENKPGTTFLYSNAGYVVAGAMLETLTGRAWEDLMRDEVFIPLGLNSAGFGPPGTSNKIDQPRGHRARMFLGLKSVEPGLFADNPAAIGPAGTVHISVCDLLVYAKAHLEQPAAYLQPETWQALHQDQGDGYALGWGVSPDGTLSHAGSNTLWFAVISVWPDRNMAAAIVINDGRIGRMNSAVIDVLGELEK